MKKTEFIKPQVNTIEKLSAELIVVNEKLKKTQAEITEILQNISHDLRAPATAMRCSIDILKSTSCNEISTEEYEMIIGVLDRRMGVIENLLKDLNYLTDIDVSKLEINLLPIDIVGFLAEYYQQVKADPVYNNRVLHSQTLPENPILVMADSKILTRVLDNLYSNALKYSHDGAKIELGFREEEYNILFWLQDTGVGISKEHVDLIFDRSYRVSDARTPGNGSGLGLSIVRGIIEKHNGKVWCESSPGKGSAFYIELPKI